MIILEAEIHQRLGHGAFKIRRIHPGAMLGNPDDAGFGGLGMIDHATLQPGLIVKMHEHRDDEIVSYLRSGLMVHKDTAGHHENILPDRLMVMNAGAGLSHEETAPGPGETRMLQIFIRPASRGLRPTVQFADLDSATSPGGWRLLVAPEGQAAPATVRQQIFLFDIRVDAGADIVLPERDGFERWLYVFSGSVGAKAASYPTHTGLALTDREQTALRAIEPSELVLFLVDRNAAASRAGAFSGSA
ncbi:MAG: pirin family protein [Beijerinckiaceae bacterium]|nr:pirin family protein [Beijerinckiaceae bacterium]